MLCEGLWGVREKRRAVSWGAIGSQVSVPRIFLWVPRAQSERTALSLGERVSRSGAFTSRSATGEGSFASSLGPCHKRPGAFWAGVRLPRDGRTSRTGGGDN